MKGICFKEPLHLKVVAGEKTKTRRTAGLEIVSKQPNTWKDKPIAYDNLSVSEVPIIREKYKNKKGLHFVFSSPIGWAVVRPRYQPGEIVFLKEPYWLDENRIHYKYDGLTTLVFGMWKNKLFMPEQYARHFIQIISVTAERAWEITEADAIAEGCKNRAEFESLWMQINGISSWKDNPWVWVYEFKLINKTT